LYLHLFINSIYFLLEILEADVDLENSDYIVFHLVCILYCGCFNLFCNVWVSECGGVLTSVWVFGNMYTCIYCVFIVFTVLLYCFFYVYLFLFVFLYYCKDSCHLVKNKLQEVITIIIIIIIIITLSPVCRVFINIFLRQSLFLSNTMSQPFCRYCLWCPYH
jgi:hypothetical protein